MFKTRDLDKLEIDHGKLKFVYPYIDCDSFQEYLILSFEDTYKHNVKQKEIDSGLLAYLLLEGTT